MTTTTKSPAATRTPCGCTGSKNPKPPGDCGCGCGGHGNCTCTDKSSRACQACDDFSSTAYVRPRFFAGQLLTESDLQQTLDYVLAKNRLHNRHLFGDGVVCGLEVHSDDCDGQSVVVEPGYALDCCGNDLVVPCPVTLSVRTLLQQLRDRNARDCSEPCPPPRKCSKDDAATPPAGKKIGKDEPDPNKPEQPQPRCYDLYLIYCESQTDPVSPYDTGDDCSDTCEFTRVHEGFRFELRCPAPSADDTLLCRLLRAHQSLQTIDPNNQLPSASTVTYTADQRKLLLQIRDRFLDHLDDDPTLTLGRLRQLVTNIPIPDVPAPAGDVKVEDTADGPRAAAATTSTVAVSAATTALSDALNTYRRDFYCRALLPPCPPCDDPAVLIARIDMNECRAIHVCNTARKFVITAPNLRYWLPVQLLARQIDRYCCDDCETPDPRHPLEILCGITLAAKRQGPAIHGAAMTAATTAAQQQAMHALYEDLASTFDVDVDRTAGTFKSAFAAPFSFKSRKGAHAAAAQPPQPPEPAPEPDAAPAAPAAAADPKAKKKPNPNKPEPPAAGGGDPQ